MKRFLWLLAVTAMMYSQVPKPGPVAGGGGGGGTGPAGPTGPTGPTGPAGTFSGLTTNAVAVATSSTAIATPCTGCTLSSGGNLVTPGTVSINTSGVGSIFLGDSSITKSSGQPWNFVSGNIQAAALFVGGIVFANNFGTQNNCSSSASPAVCGSAVVGSFVIAASTTSVVVNTSAVTANSQIMITEDSSLGTKLGVTCNTTVPSQISVTARVAATSFTLSSTSPTTNPACFSYFLIN